MSTDRLEWVGAAPLEPTAMKNLRSALILRRSVFWLPLTISCALVTLFILELPLATSGGITTLSLSILLGIGLSRLAGNSAYRRIKFAMLRGLDVAPMFDSESRTLGARLFGPPIGAEILDVLMRPTEDGEMAKEQDKWGRVKYRTRAKDPRGPAAGGGSDTIDHTLPRIDGMGDGEEYAKLEGPLTKGEKLVEEANVIRHKNASEAWEVSEANDPELTEAGMERLGDLVSTGHFAETAAEGEFPAAPALKSPDKATKNKLGESME